VGTLCLFYYPHCTNYKNVFQNKLLIMICNSQCLIYSGIRFNDELANLFKNNTTQVKKLLPSSVEKMAPILPKGKASPKALKSKAAPAKLNQIGGLQGAKVKSSLPPKKVDIEPEEEQEVEEEGEEEE